MINLLEGKPGLDLLPLDRVARSTQAALTGNGVTRRLLQYGDEFGDAAYLGSLAKFLTERYGTQVRPDQLCATPGASLSLQHLLTMLTRPESTTRYAFFQDPTYHLVYQIYNDAGFKKSQFIGIPDDSNGLDVDALEIFLEQHLSKDEAKSEFYSAVLYCVPTHANPTSSILSAERRQKLVQLARQYNVLVICDDVYDFLTFEGVTPKRTVAFDLESMTPSDKPTVISNGSFSKILAPGMRAGWIEAHPSLIQRVGSCGSFISGGSPSNFANEMIAPMLESSDPELSLHHNIAHLRSKLHERLKKLWAAIETYLIPLGCSSTLPSGGYFVWVQLPPGVDRALLEKVMDEQPERDIVIGWGNLFGVPGDANKDRRRFKDHVRLCFAYLPSDTLEKGVIRLAELIHIAKSQ
ncbi:aspartate tyrosine aromatic aminotransferase [Lichtheimia corymbifera JMRC:FSU:9682]|uniref:Aspartate tyrosine aromatic aminotransferase n=1 Tax=Lichtheimia corymbifera JMRC:FSU:9682 TaxID=1263082 RepID=A0A068RVF6_9FUNG|nr:aspartate tyrosine aromatic aminotransferase [Lichtheimia corymbifera JMRC:FSU:9682]